MLRQDVDHLLRHTQRTPERAFAGQRRADVYRDHDIRAERAREVDRQIAHQAAVDEQAALDAHRRKHARHRKRRADRHEQRNVGQLHQLARQQIRCDRTKRQRESVSREIVRARRQQTHQRLLEGAVTRRGGRQRQAMSVDAKFDPRRQRDVFLAPPKRQLITWRSIRHHEIPVRSARHFF